MKLSSPLTALLLAAALAGCGSPHDSHYDDSHDEHAEHHEHAAGEITLDADRAREAGVMVDTVRPGVFSGVVRASGQILPATGDEATVVANVAGIVALSRPWTEGGEIGRGAAVATINTASLPEGDASARAAIEYERARAEYERAESLIPDRLITMSDYNAARAEYERARLAYEALGSKRGRGGVGVAAPIGGYVKALMVGEGDYVDVGQPIMTITQNRRLRLRAEVSERDYAALSGLSSARFTTAYSGDSIFDLADLGGRLIAVGRTGSDASAFIPATFELDNSPALLPGSFADIYLLTAPETGVISVPESALTEEQGVFYVYRRLDDDCYRKQEVKPGRRDGRRVEILSGLSGGEEIVTRGAIHVRLASAANVIPGHTHNH